MKEIVNHYMNVKEESLPEDFAVKTTIRWLIKGEEKIPIFAMRYYTIEIDGYVKPHKHPWEHEIFILNGRGKLRIGNNWYEVSKGYYIYIPPNIEHEFKNTGNEKLEFLCMIPKEPTTK